jgi:hypothetical protein
LILAAGACHKHQGEGDGDDHALDHPGTSHLGERCSPYYTRKRT